MLSVNKRLSLISKAKSTLSQLRRYPTNQENWPNVYPYMALFWANVLAIVPTLGQFFWFVG